MDGPMHNLEVELVVIIRSVNKRNKGTEAGVKSPGCQDSFG